MRMGESLRRRRTRRSGGGGPRAWLDRPAGRMGALLAGVALVGLAVGYLFSTRILFPAPPPPGDLTTVPDVSGLDVQAASERILDVDLVPGTIRSVRHPEADSGRIIAQAPLPGQLARPGSGVRLTISQGPERGLVPDVVGLRREWAVSLLEAAGFRVEADTAEAAEPRGVVVAVEPEPGTGLTLPADILVTVSTGPPLVAMPALLGMTEEEARDTLGVLGFEVDETEEVFRFGRDRGLVVGQDPPADALLPPGATVRLSVGRR